MQASTRSARLPSRDPSPRTTRAVVDQHRRLRLRRRHSHSACGTPVPQALSFWGTNCYPGYPPSGCRVVAALGCPSADRDQGWCLGSPLSPQSDESHFPPTSMPARTGYEAGRSRVVTVDPTDRPLFRADTPLAARKRGSGCPIPPTFLDQPSVLSNGVFLVNGLEFVACIGSCRFPVPAARAGIYAWAG